MPEGPARHRGPRRPVGAPVGPDEVRRAILDAAADLFAHRGVDAISLRDVALAAEVHFSLIRRYVGTRDQLIDAVLEDLADQVAQELADRPLEQLGWDLDSPMGRWTRLLLHFVIADRSSGELLSFNPVASLADVIQEAFGLDAESARVRSAQVAASALGWRIFEDYLILAGDLSHIERSALRDDLHLTHQWLSSIAWPTRRENQP